MESETNATISSEENVTDVFEVFKTGYKTKEELESMDFAKVRATYTMLVPIESKDQIKDCKALATVPRPGILN